MNKDFQSSIFLITSSNPDNHHFGTGFAIHRDTEATYILTCMHVITDVGGVAQVRLGNYPVTVIAFVSTEGPEDLAVIRVEVIFDTPLLKLSASGKTGNLFIAIGWQKFAQSFLIRSIRGRLGEQVGLQSRNNISRVTAWDLVVEGDYYFQRGYSGSPVIDEQSGDVVAVVSHRLGEGQKGLAISIEILSTIWSECPPGLLRKPYDLRLGLKLLKSKAEKLQLADENRIDLLTLGVRLSSNLDDRGAEQSDALFTERTHIVQELRSLASRMGLDFDLLCRSEEEDMSFSERYRLSTGEKARLYEIGTKLENEGLRFEAAAQYLRIWQSQSDYADVERRLTDLEEPGKRYFAGRTDELSKLRALLEHSLKGGGASAAFIIGEAGSGKTALVKKFLEQAQDKDKELVYAVGSCSAHSGMGEAYLPFKEMFSLLCGEVYSYLAQENTTITNARRLLKAAPEYIRIISELMPNTQDKLIPYSIIRSKQREYGIQDDDDRTKTDSFEITGSAFAGSTSNTIQSECLFALQELATRRPLILFLDDLHWSDPSTINLMTYLIDKLRGSSIMIIGSFRPSDILDKQSSLFYGIKELQRRHKWIKELDIDQANTTFLDDFMAFNFPNNRFSPEFVTKLRDHTGGNALFVSELLSHMQATKAIFLGDDDVWKVNAELHFEELPDEVEKLIDLRISQLEIDLRRKLEIASVEGEEFTTYVIAKLDGTEERRLLEQLSSELDRKLHLVSPSRSLALQDRRIHMYRFKHALFQKFIYNRLDKPRRESLHRDIGEFIEVIYGEDVPQVASLLAEHFRKGELPEKEIKYRLIAAQEAQRVGSSDVVLDHLKRLETILTVTDASVSNQDAALKQLYDMRGHIYARIPEPERARKDLQQLEILAHQEQNMYYVARAFYGYGVLERALGRFDIALEFVGKVEAMELEEEHPAVVADSRLLAAKTSKDLAAYQDAKKWAESAQTIYEKLINRIGLLDSRSQIAYAHYAQGHYPEAEKIWMDNSVEAPELTHLPPDPDDDVYFCLGFLNWRLMRYEKAKGFLLAALRSAEQMGYVRKKAYCLNNLGGLVEASLGNFVEAEKSLTEAIKVFEELGDKKGLCWALGNMGNVLMQTGRIPEAITNLQESQKVATEIGLKSSQAESSRRISWAYLRLSDLSEAYRYANIALREAEEIGRRAFVGKAYLVLGEIAIESEKTSERVLPDLQAPTYYLELSLQIAQETQNPAEEIEILHRLGNYLMDSDDPNSQSRGQEFIQRASSLQPQNGD